MLGLLFSKLRAEGNDVSDKAIESHNSQDDGCWPNLVDQHVMTVADSKPEVIGIHMMTVNTESEVTSRPGTQLQRQNDDEFNDNDAETVSTLLIQMIPLKITNLQLRGEPLQESNDGQDLVDSHITTTNSLVMAESETDMAYANTGTLTVSTYTSAETVA